MLETTCALVEKCGDTVEEVNLRSRPVGSSFPGILALAPDVTTCGVGARASSAASMRMGRVAVAFNVLGL